MFHVELVYGGLFQIVGVSEQDLEPVLMIECPRFLFPFARRIIADLTARGRLPAVHARAARLRRHLRRAAGPQLEGPAVGQA